MISRIGNHIYARDADVAVKLYKDAFGLTEEEPWRDEEGLIIHQNLWKDTGEHFLSVTEYKHLPNDSFIKKFSADNFLSMLFYVFFSNENDMRRAFGILTENAKLVREIELEGEADLVCELVDKFGVFWHLRVPKDPNVLSGFFTKH